MTDYRENLHIIEDAYQSYLKDPTQLGEEWRAYFEELGLHSGHENGQSAQLQPAQLQSAAPSLTPSPVRSPNTANSAHTANNSSHTANITQSAHNLAEKQGVYTLIDSYRGYGYLAADIDPLEMSKVNRSALDLSLHNLGAEDMDKVFDTNSRHLPRARLREIIQWMEQSYCGKLAIEFSYLRNQEERNWIADKIEQLPFAASPSLEDQLSVYGKVFKADYFERFLGQKYVGKKRFSLEGSDSFIPLMDTLVIDGCRCGITTMVVSMAHRGRLNVLSNIFHKPAQQIFAEFEENYDPQTSDYGDVKYHLGYSVDRETKYGNIHLSLMFNPSHLESGTPVALGSVKARQEISSEENPVQKEVPILIHGDAAFMGQGVSAETLNLARLNGYGIGGSIHIVINNQIGFTTLPSESRSTEFATDLAKGFQIPIIHVNNDAPLQVCSAALIALEYRQKFGRDVIIDLVSFRRRGHNETDEPAFTQPIMYKKIVGHKSVCQIFREQLLEKASCHTALDAIEENAKAIIHRSFERAQTDEVFMEVDAMKGVWASFKNGEVSDAESQQFNGRDLSGKIKKIIPPLTKMPSDLHLHPKLRKFLQKRQDMFQGKVPIDWSSAEALAFATILFDGYNVRLSGQDAQRGTFSQRHAVLTDVQTGAHYIPLQQVSKKQGNFTVLNSPLSEYSVLAYEYGYSLSDPRTLVIWEAQFGDFINGAQIVVDQFISSSFTKWYRLSALVLLLPHGYEGQGPEHSSARPERFLQLCARKNMKVVNCSRPDQYFHLLREQILGKRRIPLVIFSPKSMLRLPQATSSLADFTENKGFQKILVEAHRLPLNKAVRVVDTVIICSGKIIYDVLQKIRRHKDRDRFLLIRLEQFYPFPQKQLVEALQPFANKLLLIRWLQEEPINQGGWFFIEDHIYREVLPVLEKLRSQPSPSSVAPIDTACIARRESASPAAGLLKIHINEQQDLVKRALSPPIPASAP